MTQYKKLQQVVENPKNYKLQRNSQLHWDIKTLIECGQVHTYKVTRSGGYTNIKDSTARISELLDSLKIEYSILNDAPKGGKHGTFIKLTGRAINKEIEAVRQAKNERLKAMQASKEKQRELAKKRQDIILQLKPGIKT